MRLLNKGEYSGKIVSHFNVDKSLITNTLYSFEQGKSYWHYHENLQLSFVFQNGKAETKKNSFYTQKGGSIFFYHAGEMHIWNSPNPVSKSVNIEIEHDFLKKYDLTENDIRNSVQKNIDAKGLILKMQREMQLNDANSPGSIQSLLLELVNYSKIGLIIDFPQWIIVLRDLLNDSWNKNLTLSELSKELGVHPVTISKYFRKYFGCTLGEYRRKLKTNRSIDLIKNSNLSLTEIAHICGFSDQSHFIRNFKSQTNFLPKEFQRL